MLLWPAGVEERILLPLATPKKMDSTSVGGVEIFAVILVGAAVYLIPSIVARHKPHSRGVLLLNLFLGWTVVGWFAALIWAYAGASVRARCPECRERVDPAANVCPHCRSAIAGRAVRV